MTYTVTFADLQEQDVAVECRDVRVDEISAFLGDAFSDVMNAVRSQGVAPTGPPFARLSVGGATTWQVRAGFPVSRAVAPARRVVPDRLPGGHVARTVHTGPYKGVAAAHQAVDAFILENGFEPSGDPWEAYLDDPDVARPRTEVFVPCRPVTPVHPVTGVAG